MAEGYPDTAKVYVTEKLGKLSIRDMLAYVEEHGVMRVSDLHIKVGTPPAYRIDGNLVKLKVPPAIINHIMQKQKKDVEILAKNLQDWHTKQKKK